MGIPVLENSDKMIKHMNDVANSTCDHKPKRNELGALVNPLICEKCGFELNDRFLLKGLR